MIKYLLIIFTILFWYFAPQYIQANENWTPEFKEFCAAYMPYVNKYEGIKHGTFI